MLDRRRTVNVEDRMRAAGEALSRTADPADLEGLHRELEEEFQALRRNPRRLRQLKAELDAIELSEGAYELAALHETGGNLEAAEYWYRKAAENDYGDAALRLAVVLERLARQGSNLAKEAATLRDLSEASRQCLDLANEAIYWYARARDVGDMSAAPSEDVSRAIDHTGRGDSGHLDASESGVDEATVPSVSQPARASQPPGEQRFGRTDASEGSKVVLTWPGAHEETASALSRRGWEPVPVEDMSQLATYLPKEPTALLIDPLTGPVTKTALTTIRNWAIEVGLPLVVAAGLGEVAADALYGSDPAALLRALTPHGRKNGRPARVLLIEGDAALATAFGGRLERRGMQVIHSTSGSEAVLRAAITPPDLVVVDLMLTRTSGPGIVDWLRLHDRLRETPIVTYTTASLTADAYERLRRGDSALFLQGRAETPEVEEHITLLVERMSAHREATHTEPIADSAESLDSQQSVRADIASAHPDGTAKKAYAEFQTD
jgi:CheY-like chemotaxis protein